MSLTPKQEQFCHEYLIDLNATQAAVRAGYAKNSARQIAAALLSELNVQSFIADLRSKRLERTDIDADWVLKRLATEAEADLSDLYDADGELLPVNEWPLIWRQGLVQGLEVEELFEGRGESREHVGRVRKVKLDNRIRRIELIGKHINVQAFRDQVGLGNPDGTAMDLSPRTAIAERLDGMPDASPK